MILASRTRLSCNPVPRVSLTLNLVHDPGLHATTPAAYALIVEAGEAFNALLATPAHQEQFAGLPD